MPDFDNRWKEIECQAQPGDPLHLRCCGGQCAHLELSEETKARIEASKQQREKPAMLTINGYAVSNLGLAQRAEQIQLQARARGNPNMNYREAHHLAAREFSEGGADPNQPVFAERTIEAFAESALPRTPDGRYALTGMGRVHRVEALQAEAKKDGKTLTWREANAIVRQFEEWNGWHPDKPLTFAEAQRQARAIRGD